MKLSLATTIITVHIFGSTIRHVGAQNLRRPAIEPEEPALRTAPNPGRRCVSNFQCPGMDNMCGDDLRCTLPDPVVESDFDLEEETEEPIMRTMVNETESNRRHCVSNFQCPGIENLCGADLFCTLPDPDPDSDFNEELETPFGLCESDKDCPVLKCFRAPCEVNVCNLETNTCNLVPAGDDVVPETLEGMDAPPVIVISSSDPILVTGNETYDFVLDEEPDSKTFSNETDFDDVDDEPVTCGSTLCEVGEVCCNPSCGICTPPDGYCTKQFCVDESKENEETEAEAETEEEEGDDGDSSQWPVYQGECTCSREECTVCYQVPYVNACLEMGCN